ncbi:MAG TPA: hypothetical protein VLF18_03260 [Tahibacter sp.]|uniref:hypothetical protein n=1 Tax=Tahibacter sp. TaxID=2056211 RepID=UPI002CB736CB|nr:hypothetical protein [Tahibacter sp.]HSX59198.1 hypothetical protein [Tahibacter sp.]
MAASPVGLSVASASPAPASPGKALPGWRIRWFWRWQAWRLRKAHSHEASHGVALYDSVHALDHLGYVDDFCELHAQLMRESPLLGCDAPAAFSRRLARELHGNCAMALLGAPDGSPVGYAWARSGLVAEAVQHFQQVQALGHLSSADWAELERRASALAGNGFVLALNGIGLAPRYRRGFAPLKLLLKPLIELGLQQGATRALWWAPRGSALHAMSLGFGAQKLLESPRIVCLMLADTRPLARVFAALPASGIADLLARVAPQRPPARTPPRLSAVPKKGSDEAAA